MSLERSSFTASGGSQPQNSTAFLNGAGMSDEPLWTVEDAAHFLAVSAKTVRAWQYAHRMPFVKIGGTIRFVPDELRRWALGLSVPSGRVVEFPAPATGRSEQRKLPGPGRLPRRR